MASKVLSFQGPEGSFKCIAKNRACVLFTLQMALGPSEATRDDLKMHPVGRLLPNQLRGLNYFSQEKNQVNNNTWKTKSIYETANSIVGEY